MHYNKQSKHSPSMHPDATQAQVKQGRGCQLVCDILKSAIPYLIYLVIYSANGYLHILPRYDDLPDVMLYNISAIEYQVLHVSIEKYITFHHHITLDFMAATPYLLHYGISVAYPLYLFMIGKAEDIQNFYWLLGWMLWVKYVIWYVFPTAPPWLYNNMNLLSQNGSTIQPINNHHGEGCAFRRLDAFMGSQFFFNMFSHNPVPFGAFPSGHVASPTIIFMIRPPGGNVFALYVLWIAWATIYSCHHYLFDVIGAVLLVLGVKHMRNMVKDIMKHEIEGQINVEID